MKKTLTILLVFALLLCGCSAAASKADTQENANQQEFLKDMAAGITKRLNDDKDSSTMNAEEKAAYYLKLVGYELDKIEQYQNKVFEDKVFNDLAHLYIDACQTQRFAAQNYKNSALYDALWEGGRKTRSAIIVELYSRYNLPITSEQAARYAPSTSYTISYSSSSTNDSETTDDTQTEVNSADYPLLKNGVIEVGFIDYTLFSHYLTGGVFKAGYDFEPGEYYVIGISDPTAQYYPVDNPNDFSWSNYTTFYKVNISKGQYMKVSKGVILVPSAEVDSSNLLQYNIFRVGMDIPAGAYKIETISRKYLTSLYSIDGVQGGYQIFKGDPCEIETKLSKGSRVFNNQEYLTVKNGDYVCIVNLRITYVG